MHTTGKRPHDNSRNAYESARHRFGLAVLAASLLAAPCARAQNGIVAVATNMCLSLGKPIVTDAGGTVSHLNDALESTTWSATGPFTVTMRIDAETCDADAMMLHYRSATTGYWSDPAKALRNFDILTSTDSTDGVNGTWVQVAHHVNDWRRDEVISFPNNHARWVRVRENSTSTPELSRLDVYRTAPAGFRNDYWIFLGASIMQFDMGAGLYETSQTVYFADLIHSWYPDYYPIVINCGAGGEQAQNGLIRWQNQVLPEHTNGTFVAFHHGGNNVSLGRPYETDTTREVLGAAITGLLTSATSAGWIPFMSRITFRNYSDVTVPSDPASELNGSLPYNTNLVDRAIAELIPYEINAATGLPLMDPYTWFREHQDQLKDGVHHTAAGKDSMNTMWAAMAGTLVYSSSSETNAPTVPANLQTNLVDRTRIGLTWSASTDDSLVGGYRIWRNGTPIDTTATTSYIDTGLEPGTTYTYAVSAYDISNNESAPCAAIQAATAAGATSSVPAGAQTILIDFGADTLPYPTTDSGWNNVYISSSDYDLIDTEGQDSGVHLTTSGYFDNSNTAGLLVTTTEYPESATRDSFWIATGHTGILTFSGLAPARKYDMIIYASRSGNPNRTTLYTATGAASKAAALECAYNTNDLAVLQDLEPDVNGHLVVQVQIGPGNTTGYGYIGLLDLRLQPLPTTTDSDADGMEDSWELGHFGNLSTATESSDFDHDGCLDRDECIAGTIPTNTASVFTVQLQRIIDGAAHVQWSPVTGRTYSVWRATNLMAGFTCLASNLVHPQNSLTDTQPGNDGSLFYRLQVTRP